MNNNPLNLGRPLNGLPPFEARLPWIGGDLQTLRNTLFFRRPNLSLYTAQRLGLALGDGSGDVLTGALNLPRAETSNPLLILIHGLTGSEDSRNIVASAAYHLSRGFPVLRLNLRNAGPSLGRCRHFYHAGRSEDLRGALAALPPDLKMRGLFLVGVSLGGNMLLKAMAEGDGLDHVIGAAAVCAPINLKAAQVRIMAPRNLIYQRHLLKALIQDTACIVADTPLEPALRRVRTLYEFDDEIVAPLGGFAGADDYYARCSAGPRLAHIEKPTLLIAAADDPWIPVGAYTAPAWPKDRPLSVVVTPGGGHVGFHAKDSPIPWHDRAIAAYIDSLR